MNLIEICTIILVHYIADFLLQTKEQADGKRSSWKWLLQHTLNYSGVFVAILCITQIYTPFDAYISYMFLAFKFGGITLILHTLTDYFTSRWSFKALPRDRINGNYRKFWRIHGFDQVLHLIQLFVTYQLLFK